MSDYKVIVESQSADITIDLHGSSGHDELGRRAFESVQEWNRELSQSIEKSVEHFRQNRCRELSQFDDPIVADRSRLHRTERGFLQLKRGYLDIARDVFVVELRGKFATQRSDVSATQQLSCRLSFLLSFLLSLVLTNGRTVDFQNAVAAVEEAELSRLNENRRRLRTAFVDQIAGGIRWKVIDDGGDVFEN